ncbi:MAG: SDR family oxidoreductase [Bacteroidales bacterium]|nr:SDR family oxidoreductase [Bacteroidales bacterium]
MKERVAIVTGASRGIGKEIAIALAKDNFHLAIVARNKKILDELAGELSKFNIRILCLDIDLEKEDAAERIIEETMKAFGQIDVLINNAGIGLNRSIEKSDPAAWNSIFYINARAPYFLCQKAIPFLRKSEHPVIINMGSVVDHKGYVNQSIYASSKHALAGFTRVLAKEVQHEKIRVHLVSPGGVNTDMVADVRPDLNTNEMIQPEEIGEIILFLCNFNGNGTIDQIRIRRFNSVPFD